MSLTVSYGYSGTNNNHLIHRLLFFQVAGVAELVDAADSKSAFREEVWVRVPPPVPLFLLESETFLRELPQRST